MSQKLINQYAEELRHAFAQGQSDRKRGVSFMSCPYRDVDRERAWCQGWQFQHQRIRAGVEA